MAYGARAYKLLQGLFFFRTDSHDTIAAQLERRARYRPNRPFLHYTDRRYTYAEANAEANRHARAYRALGIRAGDVVALVMENRPEFLWHFFGLHKLGAIASLINTNLQGVALTHAIRICAPKHVVVGSEVWSRVEPVLDSIGANEREFVDVDRDAESAPIEISVPNVRVWSERIANQAREDLGEPGPELSDQAAYIYTSGTTGLPKAAIVRHDRYYRSGRVWAFGAFRFSHHDVLYNCLPLYHSNSILLATGSVITAGASMALSRKFSRTRFWQDVHRYEATAIIYIGELCRYLLNNPPSAEDRSHRVRVASGNGLRPEIWRAFRERFGIPKVAEFYGATEGNAITLNFFNFFGSVGPRLPAMALVRWDEARGDFVRDAAGHLQRVKIGEPGIMLGKIKSRTRFDGYQDTAASEKKILRNVFEAGDAWFNTGDLLRVDGWQHLYFVDRVGDTYRWKGENVATTEVQELLMHGPNVDEASVYGVNIAGAEGRAGMAAVVLREGEQFDADAFSRHVASGLPVYARPIFVRVRKELQKTSTFKVQKAELQREGFDPRSVSDPLYFLDPNAGTYVPLTTERYEAIATGRVRL